MISPPRVSGALCSELAASRAASAALTDAAFVLRARRAALSVAIAAHAGALAMERSLARLARDGSVTLVGRATAAQAADAKLATLNAAAEAYRVADAAWEEAWEAHGWYLSEEIRNKIMEV